MVTIEGEMFTISAKVIKWEVGVCGQRLNGCMDEISNNLTEQG